MRNERLTGFVIHHRSYQEKRALYTFFCQEHGVVDGVAQRGLPLFAEMNLFATGRGNLKTFTQPSFITSITLNYAIHYASLYVNELIYRLLDKEDECAHLYHAYKTAIVQLQRVGADGDLALRRVLRQFELALFDYMGVVIDYEHDTNGNAIVPHVNYLFVIERGFCPVVADVLPREQCMALMDGQSLLLIASIRDTAVLDDACLHHLNIIHRQMIDYLLDYKPLHSRQLWQDYARLKQLSQ